MPREDLNPDEMKAATSAMVDRIGIFETNASHGKARYDAASREMVKIRGEMLDIKQKIDDAERQVADLRKAMQKLGGGPMV